MFETLRSHSLAVGIAGSLLAGLFAAALGTVGLPYPYPIVLGLALALPLLTFWSLSDRLDVDAYAAARGESGVAVDALVEVAAGAAVGVAFVLLPAAFGLGEYVRLGLGVAGVFAGGTGGFLARNRQFVRL